MIRQIVYTEGDSKVVKGLRTIKTTEITCEICGDEIAGDDDVYDFGMGLCCRYCVLKEYRKGYAWEISND